MATEESPQESSRAKFGWKTGLFVLSAAIAGHQLLSKESSEQVDSAQELRDSEMETAELPQDEAADYIILSREKFSEVLREFIKAKQAEGHTVSYHNLEDLIEMDLQGSDIPETIRNFLKTREKAKYLLLVGAPFPSLEGDNVIQTNLAHDWEMPIRYVQGVRNVKSIPTDQYYASLGGTWDDNQNGIFGEFEDVNHSELDLTADLYVGRVPVKTEEELANWVRKSLAWKAPKNPIHSNFTSNYCTLDAPEPNKPYLPDDKELSKTHSNHYHYCTADAGGEIAIFANQDGADFISTYSHGNYDGVVKQHDRRTGEVVGYELNKESPGFKKNPILFVHGCNVGGVDHPDEALAQHLIKQPDGVTAMIASTRSHWDIRFPVWGEVFFNHRYALGEAVYKLKEDKMKVESLSEDEIKNYLMFNVFGDPALQLVEPQIELFAQDEIDLEGKPERKAFPVEVMNYTSETVSGRLEPHGGPVTLPPLERTVVDAYAQSYGYASEETYPEPRVQSIFFVPDKKRLAIGGDSILGLPNGYAISCKALEKVDSGWKLDLKASHVPRDEEIQVVASIRPGYYWPESSPPQPSDEPVTYKEVYRQAMNLSKQPNPTILFPNVANREDMPPEPFEGSYMFPLLVIKLFSADGSEQLGRCGISLPGRK